MTYHKNHRGDFVPSSPIIPPLAERSPIETAYRNHSLKTLINFDSAPLDLKTESIIRSLQCLFYKPVVNFFECAISKLLIFFPHFFIVLKKILIFVECYKIDVTPCGTGIIYGGNGLGSMQISSDGKIEDNGVIREMSKKIVY